jgi:hypothetical protein
MRRIILIWIGLLSFPLASSSAESAEPTETIVRMKLQPMSAPKPALKYQLLPGLSELNPGNPIQEYLKCFADQRNFFFAQEAVSERDKWLEMSLKELPVEKLRHYGRGPLSLADDAARLDTPDWQILSQLKRSGARTLLPDINQMGTLANPLKVRFRAEIADHRFDDAIGSAKTLLAMSRHINKHPTVVARAVAGRVALYFALDPLEEMIQQPGCPNLYWALTNLPDPFVDLNGAIDCERIMFDAELSLIDDTQPMSASQIQRAVQALLDLPINIPKQDLRNRFDTYVKDESRVEAARNSLTESGLNAETVKQYPPAQVILIDEKRNYELLRDNVLKYASAPYWEAETTLAENEAKASNATVSLFAGLSPHHVLPIRGGLTAVDQRISLLRCIEGIRLYAADHNGKLPKTLSDVTVPLPLDPVTGKPFSYRSDGRTANLRGTPPRGRENDPEYNRRYEIVVGQQ